MGLFLIRLAYWWCWAAELAGGSNVVGNNSRNSRFGGFNSRLSLANSRFGLLREFTRNTLICLAVFGTKQHFSGAKRKIPGSTGITGNSARAVEWGWLTLPGRVDHGAGALAHRQPLRESHDRR